MTNNLLVDTAAIFPHPEREEAHAAARELTRMLKSSGVRAVTTKALTPIFGMPDMALSPDELARECQVVISIGGDGTLLRAFRELPELPIIGVNCGDLGFLAEVSLEACGELAQALAAGGLETSDRLVLAVCLSRSGDGFDTAAPTLALNDVVVAKGARRAPKFSTRMDGVEFATFLADAVVISTPTGSTAYNFSARGPLLTPDVEAFVVTPVAAHTLWDRSVVLSKHSEVEIRVVGDRSAVLQADGSEVAALDPGMGFRVRAADRPARMIRWGGDAFPTEIRHTFGLDGPLE